MATRHILDRLADKFTVGDGCWEWAAKLSEGYGRFWDGERMAPAHRVLYELIVGPVPAGLTLDHLCHNRACVRPDHLEPCTRGEHVRRGEAGRVTGAQNLAKTHCPGWHEYSGANLYIDPRGSRVCRTCKLDSQSRIRAGAR